MFVLFCYVLIIDEFLRETELFFLTKPFLILRGDMVIDGRPAIGPIEQGDMLHLLTKVRVSNPHIQTKIRRGFYADLIDFRVVIGVRVYSALVMGSGNLLGVRIRTTLLRFACPVCREICDRFTPKARARKRSRWALALPSTGGAVMRTLK